MSISIPCPKCGKSLRLPDKSLLGKVGRCPKCEHKFVLEEPDEVQLELVKTPLTGPLRAGERTPKVGTAAQWVPDDAPEAFGTPNAAAPVFDSVAEDPLKRLKRKRKKRPLPQRIAMFAGLVIAVIAGAYGVMAFSGKPADHKQAGKKTHAKQHTAESAPAESQAVVEENPPQAGEPAEVQNKFGRPTNGKPIDLLWIPSGARIVINMRPADLWEAGGKGKGEFIAALGPVGKWMETTMVEFLKAKPEEIEELLLCVIPGPRGAPPDYAAVVHRRKDHKFKKSDLIEGLAPVETGPVKYYTGDKWALALQPDLMTYTIAPLSLASEMISAGAKTNPTATEIEDLLAFTDRSLDFTILFTPTLLSTHGEVLVPANVQPLLESIRLWISSNDEVESVAWSFHLTEQKFYSQVMLRNRNSGNRGMVKPHLLANSFQTQLGETPRQVLELIQMMNPKQLGPRKVIGRVPAMVKVVQLGTKFKTDKQLVSMVYEGPERAAPNLALGTLLAWDESTRTNFSASAAGGTNVAQTRKPLKDLLKTKIEVDFRRTPLVDAFDFIANEAKFDIYVDGDGLKTAGYTKNMPQEFKGEGMAASAALAKIQVKYDKMCFVIDEDKRLVTVTVVEKAKAQNLKITEFK
ncbi:MAG: hypothetical protein JWM11_5616 [Planctomycetaceae bacterium]|nr:hypothetical protein [Planctomycetaceae bacterium]